MFRKKILIIFISYSILFLFFNVESFAEDGNILKSMGFGIGISFTIDTGEHDRVKNAELVDDIIRVTDEENGIPRIVLEMHHRTIHFKNNKFALGPFVAIQPGSDDIINAAAIGLMFSLKYSDNEKNRKSFNLGVGFAADPNVQILGDGLVPNQPLPGNETEIRYKEETQYGIMILFSTSW